MSTKTGIRLFWIIGFNVVGKVTAGVITSELRLSFNESTANRLAEDPLFTKTQYLVFKNDENFFSNLFAFLPTANQGDNSDFIDSNISL
tara:strand:+ start:140 stop:406 length:267 start_codon:yes stop_codon:yes gene_type:complete